MASIDLIKNTLDSIIDSIVQEATAVNFTIDDMHNEFDFIQRYIKLVKTYHDSIPFLVNLQILYSERTNDFVNDMGLISDNEKFAEERANIFKEFSYSGDLPYQRVVYLANSRENAMEILRSKYKKT